MKPERGWSLVCAVGEIPPKGGLHALVEGRQIAVFRVDDEVFALEERDSPIDAIMATRGTVGDLMGEPVLISQTHRQHYDLRTGRCLESPDHGLRTYPARVADGEVWVRAEPQPLRARQHKRRIVVVGAGMAGMRCVEELIGVVADAEIVVFDSEPQGSYDRTLLSPLLAGEQRREDIMTHNREWYSAHRVALHTGDAVTRIDRWRRVVVSQRGTVVAYQRLLLATGSKPLVLDIPGRALPGVMTFRDLRDVDAMLATSRRYKKAVVIGGGLLGLEVANGLLQQGMFVTVVHRYHTLMERQLDEAASALLRVTLEDRGVTFRMSVTAAAVLGSARVSGVRLDDGTELDADLVVMAVGIRPNIDLAMKSGLQCERGVLVDDTMQTFDPSIYAVGECIQHRNRTYGNVAPLWIRHCVCATHLAEVGHARFKPPPLSCRLRINDIDVFSAGDIVGGSRSESVVHAASESRRVQASLYRRQHAARCSSIRRYKGWSLVPRPD